MSGISVDEWRGEMERLEAATPVNNNTHPQAPPRSVRRRRSPSTYGQITRVKYGWRVRFYHMGREMTRTFRCDGSESQARAMADALVTEFRATNGASCPAAYGQPRIVASNGKVARPPASSAAPTAEPSMPVALRDLDKAVTNLYWAIGFFIVSTVFMLWRMFR